MPHTNVKMIILAGTRDFGRCPIASQLPTPLWPFAGKSVLSRMLASLSRQGLKKATICSNGDSSLLSRGIALEDTPGLDVEFLEELLPVGTAGSVRDATFDGKNELLLVFPAAMMNPPDINSLVAAHINNSAELTVVFNPVSPDDSSRGEAASIYVCNSSVLGYVPAEGYFDIKESLIPELIKAGRRVRYTVLPEDIGSFRDWRGYLAAASKYLENVRQADVDIKLCDQNDKHIIWTSPQVYIDPSARIFGRVMLLDNARVKAGTVIFGPTILERNTCIGPNSAVVNSIFWEGSGAGDNCEVQHCVLEQNRTLPENSVAENNRVSFKPKRTFSSSLSVGGETGTVGYEYGRLGKIIQRNILTWAAAAAISIAFIWSYWFIISDLWNIWKQNDEYSSGLLVPFIAGYILWLKRKSLREVVIKPSLWGLPVLIFAESLRLFGLFFMYGSIERLSIVVVVAGLVLLLFGWQFFRKVEFVLLFLILMLPWPTIVQSAVTLPLQRWATASAVFALEVMGFDVVQDGNIIHIGQVSVAVAEACNGLRMITAFFVISGFVVLLVRRAWWEKLIVFASSMPIALFCNTIRLTITAVAFTILKGEYWEKIFHDFGGYAMMPLALVIMGAELWLLTRLTTAPKQKMVLPVRTSG
jgi:exosortase